MKLKSKKIIAVTLVSLLSAAIPFINTSAAYTIANESDIETNIDEDTASSDDADTLMSELPASPYLESDAAIVINADTGQVLYEYNAYEKMYPASITKILTALVAIENGDMTSTITMSEEAALGIEEGSSSIGLEVGEQINFEDAMYAMMLVSANEASLGIAEKVSGSIAQFCTTMNKRAAELGCLNTHFTNSNGLHDEDHYTTAYDMALIAMEAIKNPTFIQLTTEMEHTIPATNKSEERVLYQETRMVLEDSDYYYEYCLGGKTGYTDEAGGTLVTWAEKDGIKLICVDMHAPSNASNYTDSISLYEYCYDNYEKLTPLSGFTFTDEQLTQAESCLTEYYNAENTSDTEFSIAVDTSTALLLPTGYSADKLSTKVSFNTDNADYGQVGTVSIEYKGTECLSVPITYTGYSTASETDTVDEAISDNPLGTDKTKKKSSKSGGVVFVIFVIIVVAAAVALRIRYVKKQRLLYKQRRDEIRRNNRY